MLDEPPANALPRLDFEAETVEDCSKVFRCIIVRSWCATGQRITTGNVGSKPISRYENFMTEVDEIDIHCLHVRSPHSQANLSHHPWLARISAELYY